MGISLARPYRLFAGSVVDENACSCYTGNISQSSEVIPFMQHPAIQFPCPRCGCTRAYRHGFFRLKNGTRKQRLRCRSCRRTFNQDTGTPLSYLKKRDLWDQQALSMAQELPLRRVAATLHIHVATAFRWRHRLLATLCLRPQPMLAGQVAASEAYIRYSEKGSRHTGGPGAHGVRRTRAAGFRPVRGAFRRFIDGKPSCVLMACAGEQRVVRIVSRGQPTPAQLQAGLAQALAAGAELLTLGLAAYAAACLRLGVRCQEATPRSTPNCRAMMFLQSGVYSWLATFRGVATRYLDHYMSWYRMPAPTAEALLIQTNTLRPKRVG